MIFYPEYLPPRRADLVDLFASQRAVRLVTLDAAGAPRVGLYPFLAWAESDPIRAEVHLVSGDAQVQDLLRDPRCTVQLDDVLSYVPSHWQGDDSALHADLFYRFVAVGGTARLVDDPAELAIHLAQLLARYQPEGGYQPVAADHPLYAPSLARLVLVRFTANTEPLVKLKLGQKATGEQRRRIAERLAEQGEAAERTRAVMATVDPPEPVA